MQKFSTPGSNLTLPKSGAADPQFCCLLIFWVLSCRCWRCPLGSFWPRCWDIRRRCCTASSARTAKPWSRPPRTPPSGCAALLLLRLCSFCFSLCLRLCVILPFITLSLTPPSSSCLIHAVFFSLPPPTCLPFLFPAIDYFSLSSPFLTLSKTVCSAESLILTALHFSPSLPVTLCHLFFPGPLHLSLLHPPLSSPLPSAASLSITLYLPPALVLTGTVYVCVWVYVCVYFGPLPSLNPRPSCSVARFPFPLPPSRLILFIFSFLPTDLSTAALPPLSLSDSAGPRSVFMLQLPATSFFSGRPLLIHKLLKFMLFDVRSLGNGSVYLDVNADAEWM